MTDREFEAFLESEGTKADADYERKALQYELIEPESYSDDGDPEDLDAWKK